MVAMAGACGTPARAPIASPTGVQTSGGSVKGRVLDGKADPWAVAAIPPTTMYCTSWDAKAASRRPKSVTGTSSGANS